ncbi:MAG TPA: hypothetical protein VFU31_06595, partial [Candidatus Binatia bacterium]|nr:hypothetical protein [Candidatus Binatia bacterium]
MESLLTVLSAVPDFIIEVITSWAGYVTGGVIVAMWWAWKRGFSAIPWRYVRLAIIGFLLASFFSVWYEQRSSFLKAADKLSQEEKNLKEAKTTLGNRDVKIEALDNQIRDQQRIINEALVQLGKTQQQEPLKIGYYQLAPIETRQKP